MLYSSIPKNNHRSNQYFLVALCLLNTLAFTLLLCSISFLAGLPVGKWQFPLGCALALVVHYSGAGGTGDRAFFLKSSACVLLLISGTILFSGLLYDVSFDGQWYHQETIFNLHQGYNPAYQTLSPPPGDKSNGLIHVWCSGTLRPDPMVLATDTGSLNIKYMNINHFSKGMEIIEASIYQLTNRIETGKAVNLIFIAAAFLLCLSLLYKIDRIGKPKKWMLAVLFSFNPIASMQMNTFCVDGNVATSLLCLVVIIGLLRGEINRYYLLLLGSLLLLALNIKFTNVAFACIFCMAFLAFLLAAKKIDAFKKVLGVCLVSGAIGLLCCGFNPYVTNFIHKHNAFYGLNETRGILHQMTPPLSLPLNRFETFFFSISAHQGELSMNKPSIWDVPKIPFTFNKEDILDAKDPQQEFSAFGPFFSGALLLAGALFVFALVYFRKTQAFRVFVAGSLVVLITVFILPDPWWGRFVPQVWWIPLFALCMAEFLTFRGQRLFKGLLATAIGLNLAYAALTILSNFSDSTRIDYQMRQLKASQQPIKVEYCPQNILKSNEVRFAEWGIPIEEAEVSGPYIRNIIESNTRFETAAPLPDLPRPLLLKLAIVLTGNQ